MDLFGEKKYEDLDLLTKMIEPVTWSLLDIFASLPDKVKIPDEAIIETVARNRHIDFNDIWEEFVLKKNALSSYRDRYFLRNRFELVVEGEMIVNLLDNTVTGGEAFIVKHKPEVTEAELNEILKSAGGIFGDGVFFYEDEATFARLREVLDLMGNEAAQATLKKRTMSQLSNGLQKAYKEVMQKNLWNIKSIDLSIKAWHWICIYVKDGNLAAMRNFCLLKAASHRGYPLYQIDEEPV